VTQELELALEEERRAAEELRSQLTVLERKRIALQTELEDVRGLLEAVSYSLQPLVFARRTPLRRRQTLCKTLYISVSEYVVTQRRLSGRRSGLLPRVTVGDPEL